MQKTVSKLDHALALARRGFWVFPLVYSARLGKWIPWRKGWQDQAAREAGTITGWFSGRDDLNIGIFTGRFGDDRALVVIDADVKAGKPGLASYEGLKAECSLSDTWTVRTPSDGFHFAFAADAPTGSPTNWRPGIDIKSFGGYVVAPGSVRTDGAYRLVGDIPPAEATGALIAAIGTRTERTKAAGAVACIAGTGSPVPVDGDGAVRRAVHYLTHADPALEGEGGNRATYGVALQVRDFGISESTCLDLMLQHFNGRCEPPWSVEEIGVVVGNAYEYAERPIGSAHPAAEFECVEAMDAPTSDTRERFTLRMFSEIEPRLDNNWLVEGLLPAGGLAVLYAKPNEGKTFVALDIGFAVSRGVAWHRCRAEGGGVLYVSMEGRLANRIAAYRQHHDLSRQALPFAAIEDSADLFSERGDTAPLIQAARTVERRTGRPLQLVVVDTLARALGGGDENTGKDMGALLKNLGAIQSETGATVLVLHHEGKDASRGARGHSSLLAAVDTALEIKSGVLRVEKQRDGETGARFGFRLHKVRLGSSADGSEVTSAVAVPTNLGAAREFGPAELKRGTQPAKALDILRDLLATDGQPAPSVLELGEGAKVVRMQKWRDKCRETGLSQGDSSAQRKSFDRALKLLMRGHVETHNDLVYLQEVR